MFVLLSEQEEDDTPKPDFKPPPEIPKEENKTGTNKKTYFVCNDRKCDFKVLCLKCKNENFASIMEWKIDNSN